MAEARTLAMIEAGLKSPLSGNIATGTGTDCLAVAAPVGEAAKLKYAGKHTAMGHVIGKTVHKSVTAGIRCWLETQDSKDRMWL